MSNELKSKHPAMPPCPWCQQNGGKCSMHPNGDSALPPPRKSPFGWASIAGANPEPIELAELDGRPCLYTIGCEDAYFLTDGNVVVYADELRRPNNLLTQEQIDEKERKWRLDESKRKHSWRGPR